MSSIYSKMWLFVLFVLHCDFPQFGECAGDAYVLSQDVGQHIGQYISVSDRAALARANKARNALFGGDNSVEYMRMSSPAFVVRQMKRRGTSTIVWDDWLPLIETFGGAIVKASITNQSVDRSDADAGSIYDPCQSYLRDIRDITDKLTDELSSVYVSIGCTGDVNETSRRIDHIFCATRKRLIFKSFPSNLTDIVIGGKSVSFNSTAFPDTLKRLHITGQITAEINWNDIPSAMRSFHLNPSVASQIKLPFLQSEHPRSRIESQSFDPLTSNSQFDQKPNLNEFKIQRMDRMLSLDRTQFKLFYDWLPHIAPSLERLQFMGSVRDTDGYDIFTVVSGEELAEFEKFFSSASPSAHADVSFYVRNVMKGVVFDPYHSEKWVRGVEFGSGELFENVEFWKHPLSIVAFEEALDLAFLPSAVDFLTISNSNSNTKEMSRRPVVRWAVRSHNLVFISIDTQNIDLRGTLDWNELQRFPGPGKYIMISGDECLGNMQFPFLTDANYDFEINLALRSLHITCDDFVSGHNFDKAVVSAFVAKLPIIAPKLGDNHSFHLLLIPPSMCMRFGRWVASLFSC